MRDTTTTTSIRQDAIDARQTAVGFEQAKTGDNRSQFLQIVVKPEQAAHKKSKTKSEPKLTRVAFTVSRLMEFCTKRELQNQTGHSIDDWPLVISKPSSLVT